MRLKFGYVNGSKDYIIWNMKDKHPNENLFKRFFSNKEEEVLAKRLGFSHKHSMFHAIDWNCNIKKKQLVLTIADLRKIKTAYNKDYTK